VEQVVNLHNKYQKAKLIMKRKNIVKMFNEKYLICNKIRHLTKDCRNKIQQSNLGERMTSESNINEFEYHTNGVLKMNIFIVVSKIINLIKNHK
jgi:hypothetical protein